jgi:peptidoglycan/LPS O-acetylase OafA/YrhL
MARATDRRIDIDILRAIAVLSVILFHFEVPGFSGGFLGVDIFFVISGYLITLHINEQLVIGEFRFTTFYLRRIRRLFPAIFVTLILTSIASLVILPKSLLSDFSLSQVAASTYVSNIYFWSIADYFDTESIVKPLLHTWSLSVEEQFYLVWPLLIYAVFRVNQGLFIVAIGTASLIAAEMTFAYSPSTVFYHFPFRVFEFAIGAMAGKISLQRLPKTKANALIFFSFISILASIFFTTEESRNPGLLSLPLCFGIAVIINLSHPWLNIQNHVTNLFVRIGLVSYSAYLIHWPLLVFYKIYHPGPLSVLAICVLLITTYLLAELMFQFVERPTLKVSIPGNRIKLALLIPAVFGFALAFQFSHSQFYRWLNPDFYSVTAILDNIPDRKVVLDAIKIEIENAAQLSNIQKTKKIVVVGDSHSVDVSLSLKYHLANTEFAIENLHGICDPLAASSFDISLEKLYQDHSQAQVKNPNYCNGYHRKFISRLKNLSPDYVIFSEAWRQITLDYVQNTVIKIKAAMPEVGIMLLGKNPVFAPHPNVIFRKLESTEEINEKAWSLRYKHLERGDEKLSAIALATGGYFISKNELICPNRMCELLIDGEMGMLDSSHWSLVGMKYYGLKLMENPEFSRMIRTTSQP